MKIIEDDHSVKKESYDLDALSSESWQLELLVSGIILLLLFQSNEWVASLEDRADFVLQGELTSVIAIVLVSVPLAINLSKLFFVLHVVIRGMWIGALGLRSVSGNIDLHDLNLHKWFASFLGKYDGSFDEYIHRLKRLASVLFSFNFLLIFYLISVLLSFSWIAFFAILASTASTLFIAPTLFLTLAMVLCGIDFVMMQGLKKGRFGFLYYPFYRVLNTLNLGFLYRSLHYNFVDDLYTQRLMRRVMILGLVVLVLSGFNFEPSPWLSHIDRHGPLTFHSGQYQKDKEVENNQIPALVRFENNQVLQVIIPFNQSEQYRRLILQRCPDMEQYQALNWHNANFRNGNFHISTVAEAMGEAKTGELLTCYLSTYNFIINASSVTPTASLFEYHTSIVSPIGIRVFISIDHLPVGLHHLEIKESSMNTKDIIINESHHLPFYKINKVD
jgi:hypothetical protein